MALPPPINNTELYLSVVVNSLIEMNERLTRIENELQHLNNAAIQKPSIQLDVVKLADSITTAIQHQSKLTTLKSKAG